MSSTVCPGSTVIDTSVPRAGGETSTVAWAAANCTVSPALCAVSVGVAWSGVVFSVEVVSAMVMPYLPEFPAALSLRVPQKPGVKRCPGQINEFHGWHYRLTPTGGASPEWGIRAKISGFCRIGRNPRFSAVFRGFRRFFTAAAGNETLATRPQDDSGFAFLGWGCDGIDTPEIRGECQEEKDLERFPSRFTHIQRV